MKNRWRALPLSCRTLGGKTRLSRDVPSFFNVKSLTAIVIISNVISINIAVLYVRRIVIQAVTARVVDIVRCNVGAIGKRNCR